MNQIHAKMKLLAAEERSKTIEVLEQLRRIDDEKIYAQMGYQSLYAYCLKELAYSEGSAHRRVSAMRVLKSVRNEAILNAVRSGELSLSTLSQAHSFLRASKHQDKDELLLSLRGKSNREIQREFLERNPDYAFPYDSYRPVAGGKTEVRFLADESLLKKIEELKQLANFPSTACLSDVLHKALDSAIENFQRSASPTAAAREYNTKGRYIPEHVKKTVWQRDEGRCTYTVAENGKRCEGKYRLELDHILPFSLGGLSTVDNLRLRCWAHNHMHKH